MYMAYLPDGIEVGPLQVRIGINTQAEQLVQIDVVGRFRADIPCDNVHAVP